MFLTEHVAEYQQKGYVVLPKLFSLAEAKRWKEQLQRVLMAEERLSEPSGVRVWMCDAMDNLTKENVTNEKLIAAVSQLIGPNVEFLSVKAVFKNAKTSFDSPWHQDWHYWQGTPKISVWIALDDATPENGCLRMVPGSHIKAIEMDEVEDGKGFKLRISEDVLSTMQIESVPVSAGDAIFFHDLALHASCPNINGQDRWTAIATYRNGSESDPSTVWEKSLPLRGTSFQSL